MLTAIVLISIFLLLILDSYGFQGSSAKYLGIDSRFILIIYIIISTVLILFNRFVIPKKVYITNLYLFSILFFASLIMILINYYTFVLEHNNFIFRLFNIHIENFIFVTLFSGMLIFLSYSNNIKTFNEKLVYLLGPLILIILIFIDLIPPIQISPKDINTENYPIHILHFVSQEDGFFESIQFILYVLAGFLSFVVAYKLYINKNTDWYITHIKPAADNILFLKDKFPIMFFIILGTGLLFIAAEEISWGQRIIGVNTPEPILVHNIQNEITLHNLTPIQSNIHLFYIAVGLLGALSNIISTKLFPSFKRLIHLITPTPITFFYFAIVAIYYFLDTYLVFYYQLFTFKKEGYGIWQESIELFLAMGFFISMYITYKNLPGKDHK